MGCNIQISKSAEQRKLQTNDIAPAAGRPIDWIGFYRKASGAKQADRPWHLGGRGDQKPSLSELRCSDFFRIDGIFDRVARSTVDRTDVDEERLESQLQADVVRDEIYWTKVGGVGQSMPEVNNKLWRSWARPVVTAATSCWFVQFGYFGSVESMPKTFRIVAEYVVSEVIDGEAVMMDLRTGSYFSATGAGAPIWADLEARRNYRQILQSLTAQYSIDSRTLTDALDRFLADLVANNLVEEIAIEEPADNNLGRSDRDTVSTASVYKPPVLTIHTDMQDLLLLDPIHDVDSAGWPMRKT